jgi:hypothetical protein
MAEHVVHGKDCYCRLCAVWFNSGYAATGRCRHCQEPIDRHRLDEAGIVIECPKTRARK